MTNPLPLIYIIGVGRSGSTLLERMLASIPGAAGMGEVHSLWRIPLVDLTCSCGAPGPDCPLWSETLIRAGIGEDRLASLRHLEETAIRHKQIAKSGFSVHRYAARQEVREFLAMQEAIFTAFAELSCARLLIDSSKAAPRAWALSSRPETRLVRLRRGAQSVAKSWRARKHDPSLDGPMEKRSRRAQGRERLLSAFSTTMLSASRGVAEIRYEDLAKAPRATLQSALGPGVANAVAWRGDRLFLPDPNYHSLNGNPDRFEKGLVEVRPPADPRMEAA